MMSKIDDADLGGLGVFWSGRRLGLSLIVCEWSMRGRTLEEPVCDSGEVGTPDSMLALQVEGMADIPAWTGFLCDDGPL